MTPANQIAVFLNKIVKLIILWFTKMEIFNVFIYYVVSIFVYN